MMSAAAAQQVSSKYTSVAPEDCQVVREELVITEFACEGLNDWTVIITDMDLRQSLKLRKNDVKLDPKLRLGRFNQVGDTLEWRGSMREGGWQPFALILRWLLDDQDRPDIQRLYVFRFAPEEKLLCPAGYVEVAGNPDHNSDAHKFADRIQEASSC